MQPKTTMEALLKVDISTIAARCKAQFRYVATAALVFAISAWSGALHATPSELSDSMARMAKRLHKASDAGGRPFAIVDKKAALLMVFDSHGYTAGSSPVLLGRTLGDDSSPGVGERAQRGTLRTTDLTTPAGRFVSSPGRNHEGDSVIWVDYEAAFAIHRLRGGIHAADRARRLSQPGSAGKRVSAGCVVVPVAFFEQVVLPFLGQGSAVVYVLPEEPVQDKVSASAQIGTPAE